MADGTIKILTDLSAEGFKKGLSKLGSIAKTGLSAVTTGIAAVSAGLVAAAGYAVKVGADFEAGMSEVAAISGASGAELEALSSKAKEMGSTTKFSATESAEALKYMAMAGWDTQAMLDGLPGVMNLAAASGEDLGVVSDIVTDSMTAFGLSADKSAHFADVLAQASSKSNTNVAMMGETFKYVAPVAGALGYSVEDTAVAIGLMANSGIKGSQAGTALRGMLSRMAKPTDEVEGAMKKLGVSLTDSEGNMRAGFAGLSEEQKAQYAATIAGQEGMSGLLAIVGASDEEFDKLKESIYNADGAAEQMAETMQDNLQGAVTIAKSALEGLGISVYEQIQTPLKEAVQKGTAYIGQLQAAFEENGIAGAVEALGGIFADVATQLAQAAPAMLEAAVAAIESFLSGLRANLPQISAAAVDVLAALAEGVLILLPELLTLGGELLLALAEGVAAKLPALLTQAADAVQTLVSGLAKGLPTLVRLGAQILSTLAGGIADALPQLIPAAAECVTGFFTAVIDALPQLLEAGLALVMGLADGILASIPALIAALPALIQGIVDFVVNGIPMVIDAAVQLVRGVVAALPTIIQALVAALPQIIESLVSGLIGCVGQLVAGAIQLVVAVVAHLPEIIAALIAAIPEIVTAVIDGFMNSLGSFLDAGEAMIDALGQGISDAWDAIVQYFTEVVPSLIEDIGTWFSELPGKVGQWLQQLLSNVGAWASSLWGKAQEAGRNFVDGVVNFVRNLPQNVWNWLQNTISKVASFATNFINKAKQAGQDFFTGLVNKVKEIPGQMLSIGRNIVQGIWNGISGAASWLWGQISGFVNGIVSNIKNFFGIASPSKLMRDEIGRFLPPGIGEGAEDALPATERQLNKDLQGMTDRLGAATIPATVTARVQNTGVLDDMRAAVEASSTHTSVALGSRGFEHGVLDRLDALLRAVTANKPDNAGLISGFTDAMQLVRILLDGETVGRLVTPEVNVRLNDLYTIDERGRF